MNKLEQMTDPASRLSRCAPDEPVFVVGAGDPIAPYVARVWAQEFLSRQMQLGGEVSQAQHDEAAEAMDLADAMDAWRAAAGGVGP